jgi:hypothetical protein
VLACGQGVPGIRLHCSRCLDPQDSTDHEGIAVTMVHRTLLDIAADAPEHHLQRALAQTERLRLCDHTAIQDVIARANGHRGSARDAALTAAGYAVVRFTWRALRGPQGVAARLKAIMGYSSASASRNASSSGSSIE